MKIPSFCFKSYCLLFVLLSHSDFAQETRVAQRRKATDSLPLSFSNRLFRKRPGTDLYTRLYNRFWAVDTASESTTRKSTWLAVPALSYTPETRLNFQAVGIYSFYTDSLDKIERNSSINAVAAYSVNQQAVFQFKPTIWTRMNRYHFTGAFVYQHTILQYFGTGNDSRLANEYPQRTSSYRLDLEGERLVVPNFYSGPVILYQSTAISATLPDKPLSTVAFRIPYDIHYAGHATWLGFNLIYDNRDNQNYATRGSYLNFNAQFAPGVFSSTGTIDAYNFDLRHFVSLGSRQVLAFNAIAGFETGSSIPFFFLNQMGNDQIMRGYYQGRFRDKNLTAAQVEYRYLFFPRFGVAAFAGGGKVFPETFNLQGLKPSYGLGGRYVFDVRSRITIRLDYAVGEKPLGEKRISGVYLALGEAF